VKNLRVYTIVLLCVTVIAFARLFRHIANEPFSIERMFSKENVLEVVAINLVVAVALAITMWLWKK
jgi:hypothetical protein